MTETCILLNGKWTFSEQLTNDCCNELVLDFWIALIFIHFGFNLNELEIDFWKHLLS